MVQPMLLLVTAALALPLASALPLRAPWTDFPGFTVCGAGDSTMNGFYSQVDASSFQLNTSTFQRKNMLFFDAVPLPHMKGPYVKPFPQCVFVTSCAGTAGSFTPTLCFTSPSQST